MYSFARPVLGNDSWLAKVHLAGDSFHQRLRTGDDRCDLKRPFQKLFEKQGTHETRTVVLHIEVVQSRSGGAYNNGFSVRKILLSHRGLDIWLDSFPVPDQLSLRSHRAVSSVVEHYLDTVGVRGSNPL